MSVESLKSICDIAAVVLLFLTFAAGAGVLVTGNIINRRQEEKLRQFDGDLTAAKSALATQQERAAKADGRVAGLEHDAAGAKESMAKQQERAANAERRLLELQENISWRTPDRALIPQLASPLKRFTGQRYCVVTEFSDPERLGVVSWVSILLGEAHWALEMPSPSSRSELSFLATNIVLWISPNAPNGVLEASRSLVPVMERAGLSAVVFQSSWGPQPDAAPPELIRVVIFKKGPRMIVTGNAINFETSPARLFFGEGPPR